MSQPYSGDDYAHPYSAPLPHPHPPAGPSNHEDTEKLLHSNHGPTTYNARQQRRTTAAAPFVTRSRTILRIISFIIAVAVIGLLASAIEKYGTTKHMREPMVKHSPNRYNVWPGDLNLRPTWVLLAAAAIAAGISLILLSASVSSKVRHMASKTSNVLTLIISIVCLALWVAAAVYYKLWDRKNPGHDLMSWTCTHQDYDYGEIDFAPFCTRMRFAWYAAFALAVLELLAIAAVIYALVHARRARQGYGRV